MKNRMQFTGLLTLLAMLTTMVSCTTETIPEKQNELTITEWCCWGPGWGRGGLAASAVDYESHLRPQPGDFDLSLGTDRNRLTPWIKWEAKDGLIDFYSDKFPTKNILDGAGKWAGGAAYACVYIKSDSPQTINLKLASPQRAYVWLNRKQCNATAKGFELPVSSGWNRLLIKSLSPSLIRETSIQLPTKTTTSNWTLKATLTTSPDDHLELSTRDPQRSANNACLRFLSKLKGGNGQYPLFKQGDWDGRLKLQIKAASGAAETYQADPTKRYSPKGGHWVYTRPPQQGEAKLSGEELAKRVPTQLMVKIEDYNGKEVFAQCCPLTFDKDFNSIVNLKLDNKLGKQPGHFSVRMSYLDATGNVLAYNNYHSLAVTMGPVAPQPTAVPRKISCVGHWMGNTSDFSIIEHKLRWLHLAGITWHQKISQAWSIWGIRHDQKGNVSFTPREQIDKTIQLAEQLNIKLIGDLTMGYVQSDKKRDGKLMALTEEEAEAQEAASPTRKAANIRLVPYGAAPLPYYGTPEFAKTLRDYTSTLVSHYKGKINYWCGDNEIDLHSGKASTPEAIVYNAAAKTIHQAMKNADPQATYISASICRNTKFTQQLFERGFGHNCDWVDVHAHPCNPPSLEDQTIGNTSKEGLGAAVKYCDNPIIYGETSAPLAHAPRGPKGQAEAVHKQIAWALMQKRLKLISYLVTYSSGANLGFCSIYGDPHPAVCSINTSSHLVDGKKLAQKLDLPTGVQQLRVKDEATDVILLWSTRPQEIKIPVPGNQATVFNLLGQQKLMTGKDGYLKLRVTSSPIYVQRQKSQ